MNIFKNRDRVWRAFIVIFLIALVGCASWTTTLQKQLKAIFGNDFKNWYWPTAQFDNSGVGCSYDGSSGTDPLVLQDNFLASIPNALNMADPTNHSDVVTMYGYANSQKGAAQITLNKNDQNSAAFSVILPQMFKVLNLNLNVGWTNGVNTSVSFNDCYRRILIPDRFEALVMSQTNLPTLKRVFMKGKLVTTVADLYINGLSVNVNITNGFNADLAASLSNAALNSVLSSNTSLSLSVTHNSDGSFTLSNSQPVVVAMLYKLLPSPSAITAKSIAPPSGTEFKDYENYWKNKIFLTVKHVDAGNLNK